MNVGIFSLFRFVLCDWFIIQKLSAETTSWCMVRVFIFAQQPLVIRCYSCDFDAGWTGWRLQGFIPLI